MGSESGIRLAGFGAHSGRVECFCTILSLNLVLLVTLSKAGKSTSEDFRIPWVVGWLSVPM